MVENLILRLGLSLMIGLVVGLERGWRERDAPAGSRTAGIRTYGLCGLLGGVFAALSAAFTNPYVFVAGFLGFAAVFTWFAWREAQHDETYSVTGVIAALLVFGLGGIAVAGDYQAAAAAGVVLAGVLASRQVLHDLLRKMSWVELRSALLLLGMTAVVLPLLSNRTVDPWGGVNPWEIWFFTVLTAAISYAGYIAVRLLGPGRGILVSGLAGALVSSTAVTVAFGRRAKSGDPVRPMAAGAVLAAMVSALRVFGIVLVVKPEVALFLVAPVAAAAVVFGAGGFLLLGRNWTEKASDAKLGNPFEILPLFVFAVSFVIVAALSAALTGQFGSGSVILTSAFSGIFDVDVAALTAARLVGAGVTAATAAAAILLAIALNAGARVAVAVAVGPPGYFLPFAGVTAIAAAAGAVVWWIVPAFAG
jgi:uncharacterized membrane protein (DUF4010 family)